ncbi:hypothetical protein [Bradyrhizobium sp. SEMIA]|uniref:hypothetical protein n=1 Tax=Bradyrhizobium sp. SEMIA TaxID=2597515 RepID=UPI0018A53A0E|nr:hypothetical protein [Bradyrhizobium sp. SEMIA]QOG21772.1 hypothetical protein FOM02_35255 [Bradyrhizobium sp. SEMIA]
MMPFATVAEIEEAARGKNHTRGVRWSFASGQLRPAITDRVIKKTMLGLAKKFGPGGINMAIDLFGATFAG